MARRISLQAAKPWETGRHPQRPSRTPAVAAPEDEAERSPASLSGSARSRHTVHRSDRCTYNRFERVLGQIRAVMFCLMRTSPDRYLSDEDLAKEVLIAVTCSDPPVSIGGRLFIRPRARPRRWMRDTFFYSGNRWGRCFSGMRNCWRLRRPLLDRRWNIYAAQV